MHSLIATLRAAARAGLQDSSPPGQMGGVALDAAESSHKSSDVVTHTLQWIRCVARTALRAARVLITISRFPIASGVRECSVIVTMTPDRLASATNSRAKWSMSSIERTPVAWPCAGAGSIVPSTNALMKTHHRILPIARNQDVAGTCSSDRYFRRITTSGIGLRRIISAFDYAAIRALIASWL